MKQLFFSLALLCLAGTLFAQPTDYYNEMNHTFGQIDKTKVSTGLLKDFGIRFNHVENYHGTINTTNWVDKTQWYSLYHSLYSMRVGTATTMTAPKSVYNYLTSQQELNPDIVLLAAEYYQYNEYKTNAYSNGDVQLLNGRIIDIQGRNPYTTKNAFAVSPLKYHLKGNTFSFKLPSDMIYTNSSKTLSTVQIDFDNGQGYQTVSLNTIKNVTYTSGGEKELKFKFVYTNGPTLYSHAKLYIDYENTTQARFSGDTFFRFNMPLTGAAYQGATATGEVTIELAPNNTVFDKPLIVIEGFDPLNTFDYGSLIDRDDPGGLEVEINIPGQPILTLNQAIEDEGYDLVFVNYRNGTDFIQRNAFMVEAVINWVNNNKVGNEPNVVLGMSMGGLVARYALRHMETIGQTHETSLYISHDVPHQGANVPLAYQTLVRHLVGESVSWPLFLGAFELDVVDLKDVFPVLDEGFNILKSPAAQQMLIYQLQGIGSGTSIDNTTLYQSFATEYKNLGYPSQGGIKNIAISNGSECGTPLDFDPYATLLNVDRTVDLPYVLASTTFLIASTFTLNPLRALTSFLSTDTDIKAQFNLRALPDQSVKTIYNGRIFIKKEILWGVKTIEEPLIGSKYLNSSASMLPLDNAGGGIYDIDKIAPLGPEIREFLLEPRFSFIPTYSSLDVGSGTQTITTSDLAKVYSPAAPPTGSKNIQFDNFFTNPITSENHIQFTLNNGNWLLSELKGQTAFYSCANSCIVKPDVILNGSSLVCSTNRTFSIANPPLGGSIQWSKSSNLAYVSGQGTNNYKVKASTSSVSGSGWVKATINTNCGIITEQKDFWVGNPKYSNSFIQKTGTDQYNFTHSNAVSYYVDIADGATSYNWFLTSGQSCGSSYNGPVFYSNGGGIQATTTQNQINVNTGTCNGDFYIRCEAVNSCGVTSYAQRLIRVSQSSGGGNCSMSANTFPNPSRGGDVTINLVLPPPDCDSAIMSGSNIEGQRTQDNDAIETIIGIEVFDNFGNQICQDICNINSYTLDTENLNKGVYIINIYTSSGLIFQERLVRN